MNKNFLKKMEKRLRSEQEEILKRAMSEDNNIDCDGDETDEIQASLLIYVSNQMNTRYKNSLTKIQNALDKIAKNEYGLCEECEEEIPEKRLEFNPHFSNCVFCAELKEKNLRRSH